MFLEKYITDFNFNLLLENYEESFLVSLDENNFFAIYNIFKKYNFYFIDDIIVNYLEIFTLDKTVVEINILRLKKELGDNFVSIIGKDLRLLERILDNTEEESNSI